METPAYTSDYISKDRDFSSLRRRYSKKNTIIFYEVSFVIEISVMFRGVKAIFCLVFAMGSSRAPLSSSYNDI